MSEVESGREIKKLEAEGGRWRVCWCEVTGELKKAATLTKVNSPSLNSLARVIWAAGLRPGQKVNRRSGSPWNPVDHKDDTIMPLRPPLVASPSRHLLISSAALGVTLQAASTSAVNGLKGLKGPWNNWSNTVGVGISSRHQASTRQP